MADKTMPPLPSGSVDLDALHKADAKGHDLAEAIDKATARKEPPKKAKAAAKPARAEAPATPPASV
jgi:hypothetical protein